MKSAAICTLLAGTLSPLTAQEAQFQLHTFERQQLTETYFSEGANTGDLNGDGHIDIVYGPYWFEGPQFTQKHEIYPAKPQPTEGYADNFFSWIHDFNADGRQDVLVVGFPGTPAFVYENPGDSSGHWKKHQVFDWVSNESPHFVNLVGDERPELVCTRDGFFGYAVVDSTNTWQPWKFQPISERIAPPRFGHGLGVGDINGDGRLDIIHASGWFEQPAELSSALWQRHDVKFTDAYGGAEMFAYDVDGDGDNDVITSLAAHDFGLAWYEQLREEGKIHFKQHLIMGDHPSKNRYGVIFSEPHSVALADIDGDGLKDILTGKTYYSHHQKSPMWDAGAVVYWFKLVRHREGIDWVPYRADDQSGIGRQLTVKDVNADGLLDIVVGGMKGAHVLTHHRHSVDHKTWEQAQPKEYKGPPAPSAGDAKRWRGSPAVFEPSGNVAGALEGESLKAQASAGSVRKQGMRLFTQDKWSNQSQLFWTGARPGDSLRLELPSPEQASSLEIVMTCARDYAIVQLLLDDRPLGKPIDLYEPVVKTTGVLQFADLKIEPGPHVLTVQIVGANDKAVKAFMFGLDYVRFAPLDSANSTSSSD